MKSRTRKSKHALNKKSIVRAKRPEEEQSQQKQKGKNPRKGKETEKEAHKTRSKKKRKGKLKTGEEERKKQAVEEGTYKRMPVSPSSPILPYHAREGDRTRSTAQWDCLGKKASSKTDLRNTTNITGSIKKLEIPQ